MHKKFNKYGSSRKISLKNSPSKTEKYIKLREESDSAEVVHHENRREHSHSKHAKDRDKYTSESKSKEVRIKHKESSKIPVKSKPVIPQEKEKSSKNTIHKIKRSSSLSYCSSDCKLNTYQQRSAEVYYIPADVRRREHKEHKRRHTKHKIDLQSTYTSEQTEDRRRKIEVKPVRSKNKLRETKDERSITAVATDLFKIRKSSPKAFIDPKLKDEPSKSKSKILEESKSSVNIGPYEKYFVLEHPEANRKSSRSKTKKHKEHTANAPDGEKDSRKFTSNNIIKSSSKSNKEQLEKSDPRFEHEFKNYLLAIHKIIDKKLECILKDKELKPLQVTKNASDGTTISQPDHGDAKPPKRSKVKEKSSNHDKNNEVEIQVSTTCPTCEKYHKKHKQLPQNPDVSENVTPNEHKDKDKEDPCEESTKLNIVLNSEAKKSKKKKHYNLEKIEEAEERNQLLIIQSNDKKENSFVVEGIEPAKLLNHSTKYYNSVTRKIHLECKTVAIIGIPSKIQIEKTICSCEDSIEKKKNKPSFKHYYEYSKEKTTNSSRSLVKKETNYFSDCNKAYAGSTDTSDRTSEVNLSDFKNLEHTKPTKDTGSSSASEKPESSSKYLTQTANHRKSRLLVTSENSKLKSEMKQPSSMSYSNEEMKQFEKEIFYNNVSEFSLKVLKTPAFFDVSQSTLGDFPNNGRLLICPRNDLPSVPKVANTKKSIASGKSHKDMHNHKSDLKIEVNLETISVDDDKNIEEEYLRLRKKLNQRKKITLVNYETFSSKSDASIPRNVAKSTQCQKNNLEEWSGKIERKKFTSASKKVPFINLPPTTSDVNIASEDLETISAECQEDGLNEESSSSCKKKTSTEESLSVLKKKILASKSRKVTPTNLQTQTYEISNIEDCQKHKSDDPLVLVRLQKETLASSSKKVTLNCRKTSKSEINIQSTFKTKKPKSGIKPKREMNVLPCNRKKVQDKLTGSKHMQNVETKTPVLKKVNAKTFDNEKLSENSTTKTPCKKIITARPNSSKTNKSSETQKDQFVTTEPKQKSAKPRPVILKRSKSEMSVVEAMKIIRNKPRPQPLTRELTNSLSKRPKKPIKLNSSKSEVTLKIKSYQTLDSKVNSLMTLEKSCSTERCGDRSTLASSAQQHTSSFLMTKDYKGTKTSSTEKRKSYDENIRKRMKKKLEEERSKQPAQFFEVRYCTVEQQNEIIHDQDTIKQDLLTVEDNDMKKMLKPKHVAVHYRRVTDRTKDEAVACKILQTPTTKPAISDFKDCWETLNASTYSENGTDFSTESKTKLLFTRNCSMLPPLGQPSQKILQKIKSEPDLLNFDFSNSNNYYEYTSKFSESTQNINHLVNYLCKAIIGCQPESPRIKRAYSSSPTLSSYDSYQFLKRTSESKSSNTIKVNSCSAQCDNMTITKNQSTTTSPFEIINLQPREKVVIDHYNVEKCKVTYVKEPVVQGKLSLPVLSSNSSSFDFLYDDEDPEENLEETIVLDAGQTKSLSEIKKEHNQFIAQAFLTNNSHYNEDSNSRNSSEESGYASVYSRKCQSLTNFFKRPNIAALFRTPSISCIFNKDELECERVLFFRPELKNSASTSTKSKRDLYEKMAKQCQFYAHKVKLQSEWRKDNLNYSGGEFTEIPLGVLLGKAQEANLEQSPNYGYWKNSLTGKNNGPKPIESPEFQRKFIKDKEIKSSFSMVETELNNCLLSTKESFLQNKLKIKEQSLWKKSSSSKDEEKLTTSPRSDKNEDMSHASLEPELSNFVPNKLVERKPKNSFTSKSWTPNTSPDETEISSCCFTTSEFLATKPTEETSSTITDKELPIIVEDEDELKFLTTTKCVKSSSDARLIKSEPYTACDYKSLFSDLSRETFTKVETFEDKPHDKSYYKIDDNGVAFSLCTNNNEKRSVRNITSASHSAMNRKFFENLLYVYEKELELTIRLAQDDQFFKEDLLASVDKSLVNKLSRKMRLKAFFKRKSKDGSFESCSTQKIYAESEYPSDTIADMCDTESKNSYVNYHQLQTLARNARRHFSLFAQAVMSNQYMNDEIKVCGFLKLLERIEKGDFTVLRREEDVNFEDEVRSQIKLTFANVYRISFYEAKKNKRKLTKNDLELIRVLVSKYRLGSLSQTDFIATYIGRGIIKSENQLRAAITYLIRLNASTLNLLEFEEFCNLKVV